MPGDVTVSFLGARCRKRARGIRHRPRSGRELVQSLLDTRDDQRFEVDVEMLSEPMTESPELVVVEPTHRLRKEGRRVHPHECVEIDAHLLGEPVLRAVDGEMEQGRFPTCPDVLLLKLRQCLEAHHAQSDDLRQGASRAILEEDHRTQLCP